MKQSIDRKYLGVIVTSENYKTILKGPGKRNDLRFHSKHLRSYLQGKDSFTHGWVLDEEGNKIRPQEHNVQQEIIISNEDGNLSKFKSQASLNKFLRK